MLTTDNHNSVAALFALLCPLAEEARAVYVQNHSDLDPEVVRETFELLRVDSKAGDLALPNVEEIFPEVQERGDSTELEGEVGPYRLIRQVGEGGLGKVFEAVRDDGAVHKRVALKLLHPEFSGVEFYECLQREISVLARLEHENICRLYDWGRCPSGRPYYAMEFIDGESLLSFLSKHTLTREQSLRLFSSICKAVSFAHRNLILHLDVKPTNIRVTPEGNVKLIDFSVSREITLYGPNPKASSGTVHGLSPAYASPEQISGGVVTTSSDVYSLGLVLQEILSFGRNGKAGGASDKPGRSVSEDSSDLHRSVLFDSWTRRHAIPADLASIISKATALWPDDRYESAEDLRREVESWLQHRPIHAFAGSPLYRLRNFCRRNATKVTGAMLVLGLVGAGTVAGVQQAKARTEHARAERRYSDVQDLSELFLFSFEESIRSLPGSTPARIMAVKTALRYLSSLSDEAKEDSQLARQIAQAYLKLADLQGNPAQANLGDTKSSLLSYDLAQHTIGSLQDPESQHVLARVYAHRANLFYYLGQKQVAYSSAKIAVAILSNLAQHNPSDSSIESDLQNALIDVADMQVDFGEEAAAISNYRAARQVAMTLSQSTPASISVERDLARTFSREGDIAYGHGAWKQAEFLYEHSLDIYQRLLHQEPNDVKVMRSWVAGTNNLALAFESQGKIRKAKDLYLSTARMAERLAELDPTNTQALRDLEVCDSNLTRVFLALAMPAAARDYAEKELRLSRRLWSMNRNSSLTLDDLAGSEQHYAEVLRKQKSLAKARIYQQEAVKHLRLVQQRNGTAESLGNLAEGLLVLANIDLDMAVDPGCDTAREAGGIAAELKVLQRQFRLDNAEDRRRVSSIRELCERAKRVQNQTAWRKT